MSIKQYNISVVCASAECDQQNFMSVQLMLPTLPPGYDFASNPLVVTESGNVLSCHIASHPTHLSYIIYSQGRLRRQRIGSITVEGLGQRYFIHPEGKLLDEMSNQFLKDDGKPSRLLRKS